MRREQSLRQEIYNKPRKLVSRIVDSIGALGVVSLLVSVWVGVTWLAGDWITQVRGVGLIVAVGGVIAVQVRRGYQYIGILIGIIWLVGGLPIIVSIGVEGLWIYDRLVIGGVGANCAVPTEGGVIYTESRVGGDDMTRALGRGSNQRPVQEIEIVPEREVGELAQDIVTQPNERLTLGDIGRTEVDALSEIVAKPMSEGTDSHGDGHHGLYTMQDYLITEATNLKIIEMNKIWEEMLISRREEIGGQEYPGEVRRYWVLDGIEVGGDRLKSVPYHLRADSGIVWMTEGEANRVREWAAGQESKFIRSLIEGLEYKKRSSETGATQILREVLGSRGQAREEEKDLAMREGYYNMRNLAYPTIKILEEMVASMDVSMNTSRGAASMNVSLDVTELTEGPEDKEIADIVRQLQA